MRRFLFAAGLAATLAGSRADAGYFVVRIVLEGGAGAGAGGAPGVGGPPGGGEGALPPTVGGPGPRGGPPPGVGGMPPGAGGAAPAAGAGPHDPSRSIFVVVPVTSAFEDKTRRFYPKLVPSATFNPPWPYALKHEFGTTNLFVDSTEIQLYPEFAQVPTATRTRPGLVQARYDDWKKARDDTGKLLALVTDALSVGMVDEAGKMADDLLAAVQAKKATTPEVDRFVAAYTPLQAKWKNRVPTPGPGPAWKANLARGRGFNDIHEYTSTHYYLIAWGGIRRDEADRRLDQLETNFRAFYLWHAARGVALPLPDQLLPVALTATPGEIRFLASVLDAGVPVTDGFYAPDHELLVLSPERVDDVGMTFQRQVNGYYRLGVGRDLLLHPERYDPNKGVTIVLLNEDGNGKAEGKKAAEVARRMTWAMADVFNQRDSEVAAVSREGSRQLMHASGLLPRHVAAPAWLATGAAEFFHRPRGAVLTDAPDDKTAATVGLTTGYGTPNFAQQKLFRDLADKKLLPADPAVILRNVLTDAYFTAVTNRLDADDPKLPKPKAPPGATPAGPAGAQPGPVPPAPGPMPGPMAPAGAAPVEDPAAYARRRQEFIVLKSRSTAWALYHHLAVNHPVALRRYFAELDKLPRDMPLDGNANLELFVAAFNLTTSAAPEAGKVPFARFAREWLDALATTPMAGSDFVLQEPPPPAAAPGGGPPGAPPGGGGRGGPGS